MPNNFKTHIHAALENPGLQTALDNNAVRRQSARLLAYQSLPEDIQVLRQRARAVRTRVIANLDQYLDQFCERASANGMIIHRAANAAEAVQIVLDIAKQKDARLIAKAKSMLSEEIHLNPALEEQGIQVVETDLGEYIVQLRGEPPAHIITPAVHLRAADVGHTFEEKLNLPFTEDVPTMTAAAREKLRQVFMQADIGITGVNFGVAESGTISLVTNEGNGRMVMTLPPVHIALMGIERLVPTLDDLALMLYLLPRSATGQKLSVYVSLAHSPTPQGLVDGISVEGPRERHIILVDNGRRAVSQSPLAEALYCIRCGTCLNVCPVFREIGGHAYVNIHGVSSTYPGPIGSVLSPAFFGQSEFGHLARASSLCGACKEACPVDIDLPKLLLRIRAGMTEQREGEKAEQKAKPNAPAYLAWGLRFFTWIAVSPRRFAAAQRMAGIFSRVVAPVEPWIRMPALTGWGYSKDFPRPAAKPFRDHWKDRQTQSQVLDIPEEEATPINSHFDQSSSTGATQESLVDRFCRELDSLGGKSVQCSLTDLSNLVLSFLREEKITRIQAWNASELPRGLLDELKGEGIDVQNQYDPAIRLGLTGVESAIAESGTLVMIGSPTQPLTASLVPEIHIAILPVSKIQKSLPEALASPALRRATAATLISGPSRTADIEMTLTVGMHGPRQVMVFCLTDC
jgi:L-lactate dehydrogenase complex protein LldF